MENASKALILAGSVLLGVMILGIASFLITSFGSYTKDIEEARMEKQLEAFNSTYTKYQNTTTATIHDIITLANKAIENNQYHGLKFEERGDNSYYIQVKIGSQNLERLDSNGNRIADFNQLLTDNGYNPETKEHVLYRCTDIQINPVTKRVELIQFQKIR